MFNLSRILKMRIFTIGIIIVMVTAVTVLGNQVVPPPKNKPQKQDDAVVFLKPQYTGQLKGPAGNSLKRPLAVTVGLAGKIYVVDSDNDRVEIFDPEGNFLATFGKFGQGAGEFDFPTSIAVDSEGRLYVGEFANGRIQVFDPNGKLLQTIDRKTSGVPLAPMALTFDSGEDLYVANRTGEILILNRAGKLLAKIGEPGSEPGMFSYPNGIVVDDRGRVIVSDSGNQRVQVFDRSGKLIKVLATPAVNLTLPKGIALDEQNRLYVVDNLRHEIAVVDLDYKYLYSFGERGLENGQLNFPNGIAISEGKIYVTDRENNRVVIFRE